MTRRAKLASKLMVIPIILLLLSAKSANSAPESTAQISPAAGPAFGQSRMRAFVLGNFDRFTKDKQPLPALRKDSVNFTSHSYRPDDVTFILESFAGLFPGTYDETTDNIIEIFDADDLAAQIAGKIRPLDAGTSDLITSGIADATLCWSGKLPTPEGDKPIILLSQQLDKASLSKCLYRAVMAQMGVIVLYKDLYPVEGRLDAILSHMANVTAMHLFFECRQHIRNQDFKLGRRCVEDRFDARY